MERVFDKLHAEGKMEWTIESTPFGFPVFVVWRVVNGERKSRVVIDIPYVSLTVITVPDSYPLPLQSTILGRMWQCRYISTFDMVASFYQFLVSLRPLAPARRILA